LEDHRGRKILIIDGHSLAHRAYYALPATLTRADGMPTNAVLGFCKSAEVAAKKLQDHGIKLYYHNHHVEFMKFDGKRLLNIIADEAPSLGMELDVHWIQRGGANPVEVIKEFKGRADLIHLKDYRIGAIEPAAFDALAKGDFKTFMEAFQNVVQFAEVGEGNIDMPAVIEAGLAGGAKYFFIEQDNLYGRDAFDCLITSRDNLAKMGYSLSYARKSSYPPGVSLHAGLFCTNFHPVTINAPCKIHVKNSVFSLTLTAPTPTV